MLTNEPLPAREVTPESYQQVQELHLDEQAAPSMGTAMNNTSEGTAPMQKMNTVFLLLSAAVILAGVGTGVGLQKLTDKNSNGLYHGQKLERVAGSNIQKGQIFGSPDESTFNDSAEGVLQAGGIDGEGSHKLLRPGGAAQTVYMTSSVTDLDKFIGMKVKVWGQTQKGQKAGWLMDVGRVQVEELQAQPPTE